MSFNEFIGWVATAFTMLSFLFQKMVYLRVANFTACIVWVVYGLLTTSNPVVVTNAIIALIHLHWFYKNSGNFTRESKK